MIRRLPLFTLPLVLAACDAGRPVSPEGPSTGAVTLKGKRFDVQLVTLERERKRTLPSLPAAADGKGTLLCWPRERFMKLEPREARASFDVAFLDLSGKVVELGFLEAGDPRGIMPSVEAAYVLLVAPKSLAAAKGDVADLSPEIKAAKPQELPLVRIGDVEARVELALTEAERQHGLMHRPRMSADDGMLFAYTYDGRRSFWMGNTLIPLDIAFIKTDGTIVNVNETPTYPNPENPPTPYPTSDSKGEARYVLEMNLGWFKRKGLTDAAGQLKPGLKAVLPPEALKGSD
ncbi:MAG TPA: DUF192 domain-containing protein [Planctomycetota bacterium]